VDTNSSPGINPGASLVSRNSDYDTTVERLHDMADIPYSEENRPKKLEGFALK